MSACEREPVEYLPLRPAAGYRDVTPWVAWVVAQGVDMQARDLPPGVKVSVVHRGATHWVYVVPCPAGAPVTWSERQWGRYVWRGTRYKTLTAIARRIVGPCDPRISGHRFFGLRRRRR